MSYLENIFGNLFCPDTDLEIPFVISLKTEYPNVVLRKRFSNVKGKY
jgi:hypothetical protein